MTVFRLPAPNYELKSINRKVVKIIGAGGRGAFCKTVYLLNKDYQYESNDAYRHPQD